MARAYKRKGILNTNCITLGRGGRLEAGIPINEYNGNRRCPRSAWHTVDLRQGAQETFKPLPYEGTLSSKEDRHKRLYEARFVCDRGDAKLRPGRQRGVLFYQPALIRLPFGTCYQGEAPIVEGAVQRDYVGNRRDGVYALGEAWEYDKTALFCLGQDDLLMVSSVHKDADGECTNRVVSVQVRNCFIIMRHPRPAEMKWYEAALREIHREAPPRHF